MLRNLTCLSLLLLLTATTGCRGKKATAEEERAAEGSAAVEEATTERPAPLAPDVAHPPEPSLEEGSAVEVQPAAIDKAMQLRRPALQARPMTGVQGLGHDLRAKTAAIRMHNSGIRPLMPKAIGDSVKPASPAGPSAPR